MGKIAFVFSGQGAQYGGMGKSFYDSSEAVKNLFDSCEKFRPGTASQTFSGSDEELKKTSNTQPCMYLTELAAAISLTEKGIVPSGCAGFLSVKFRRLHSAAHIRMKTDLKSFLSAANLWKKLRKNSIPQRQQY